MDGRRKPVKDSKPRRPRRGKAISVESVIFLFGLLNAGTDKGVIERVALRNYFRARMFFECISLSSNPEQRSDELRLSLRITSC